MAFLSETALKYLQRAHEQDRLAHAYLISGSAERQTRPGKRSYRAH